MIRDSLKRVKFFYSIERKTESLVHGKIVTTFFVKDTSIYVFNLGEVPVSPF